MILIVDKIGPTNRYAQFLDGRLESFLKSEMHCKWVIVPSLNMYKYMRDFYSDTCKVGKGLGTATLQNCSQLGVKCLKKNLSPISLILKISTHLLLLHVGELPIYEENLNL